MRTRTQETQSKIKFHRGAGYCRLSKAPDGSLETIERQKRILTELARRRGVKITRWFSDNNLSAWKRGVHRPGWEAMLTALADGEHDVILSYHCDRLARNGRDGERLLDVAELRDLPLFTPTSDFDLGQSGDARMVFRMITAVSIKSSDDTKRRIQDMKADRRARGDLRGSGSTLGFGWRDSEHGWEIDPDAAAVLREAADRLLRGDTFSSICADFRARGVVLPVKGVPLAPTTLRMVLRAPRTGGFTSHKGEIVAKIKGGGPLDEGTWRRVLALLDSRTRGRPNTERYLMTGLLACGKCGNLLNASRQSIKGGGERVYRCASEHDGYPGPCYRTTIKMDEVDQAVGVYVSEWLANKSNVTRMQHNADVADARAAELAGEQEFLAEQLADLGDKRLAHRIPEHRYLASAQQIMTRQDEIEAELGTLSAVAVETLPTDTGYEDMTTSEKRRAIRQTFVTPIVVQPGRATRVADRLALPESLRGASAPRAAARA